MRLTSWCEGAKNAHSRHRQHHHQGARRNKEIGQHADKHHQHADKRPFTQAAQIGLMTVARLAHGKKDACRRAKSQHDELGAIAKAQGVGQQA